MPRSGLAQDPVGVLEDLCPSSAAESGVGGTGIVYSGQVDAHRWMIKWQQHNNITFQGITAT